MVAKSCTAITCVLTGLMVVFSSAPPPTPTRASGIQAPIVAVWVMALLAAVIGAPMYFAGPYVATIETMAVVNTYLSYGIPIVLKYG